MNRLLLLVSLIAAFHHLSVAQAPPAFRFQTSVRDASGQLLPDQAITLRISILADGVNGPVRYAETHSITTNNFGLAALNVGEGALAEGAWSEINWAATTHYLRLELDPQGGTDFQLMGTTQLLSVPYALHAATAEEVDDADADPTNELELPDSAQTGDLAYFDGASWQRLPLGEEGQVLTVSGGRPSWITLSGFSGNEDPEIDTEKCGKEYEGFTLVVNDQMAQPGEQVCVDICAANFDDIVAMSFTLTYDDRSLAFDTVANVVFPNVTTFTYDQVFTTPLSPNPTEPGSLTFVWSSPELQPYDLEYGTVLFRLCFTVRPEAAAGATPVRITDDLNPIDILTINFRPISYAVVNGLVGIE